MHILITGGAGFIGSHLADDLVHRGHRVRAFDNLSPQVHGDAAGRPTYLHPAVELMRGDVTDPLAVRRALTGIDAVFHLAAAVGVGQSMYEIDHYTSTNNLGTAVLLQEIVSRPVSRLVVASSMSLYGEGLYRTPDGDVVEGVGARRSSSSARGTGRSAAPTARRSCQCRRPRPSRRRSPRSTRCRSSTRSGCA
jgi:dTDP-L-rhamnose 4-epimerase